MICLHNSSFRRVLLFIFDMLGIAFFKLTIYYCFLVANKIIAPLNTYYVRFVLTRVLQFEKWLPYELIMKILSIVIKELLRIIDKQMHLPDEICDV